MLSYGFALITAFCIWRVLASYATVRIRDKNKLLIIESSKVPTRLARKLKYSCGNLNEAVYYILNEDNDEQTHHLLNTLIPQYDMVYISENLNSDLRDKIFYLCTKLNKITTLLATPSNSSLMKSKIFQFDDTPVIETPSMRLTRPQKFVKRIFDIICSFVGLVISSPVFLIFAIAIKLDSPGPVFYTQERYTIDKKRFMLCKFRTMYEDAEKYGACLAEEGDPRITRVGKIIRKLRLDEIPQLINILLGSMSIVGPRPERPVFADEYCEIVKYYEMRYFIKAGLTGYAQVYGKYNTRASDKILMDMIYAVNYSFWLDIKLIILTIKTMFVKESTEGVNTEQDNILNSEDKEYERRKNKPLHNTSEDLDNEDISDNTFVQL